MAKFICMNSKLLVKLQCIQSTNVIEMKIYLINYINFQP